MYKKKFTHNSTVTYLEKKRTTAQKFFKISKKRTAKYRNFISLFLRNFFVKNYEFRPGRRSKNITKFFENRRTTVRFKDTDVRTLSLFKAHRDFSRRRSRACFLSDCLPGTGLIPFNSFLTSHPGRYLNKYKFCRKYLIKRTFLMKMKSFERRKSIR